MSDLEKILARLDSILDRIEPLLPEVPDTNVSLDGGAYKWVSTLQSGYFKKITHPATISLADLQCIDRQKEKITRNTKQFLKNLPANNVLLWGPRGTGKSSLIKAVLNEFKQDGLSLIEVDRYELDDLGHIIEQLANRKGHFIIYCDDLSFEADDPSYKAIKVILDGSLNQTPDNVLIYATSNRRHLTPESMSDNVNSKNIDGELHLDEAIEEKISLSERFGMWLSFHPFNQDQYLEIVEFWLDKLDYQHAEMKFVHKAALKWALEHGSRSGRSAWQFARDWTGKNQLKEEQ